jgi:predicted CXXCH cytochrome family protein
VRTRRAVIILSGIAATAGLAAACSESTRYRVLTFFFDGVPDPHAPKVEGYAALGDAAEVADAQGATARRPTAPLYAHTPYRLNQCGGCHDVQSGVTRTAAEGLCGSCHQDLARTQRFVHGPVAVNDCTVCHHPHTSPHPFVLLQDATTLCLSCHDADDVWEAAYHADTQSRSCVDCHLPHGGDDPYFLRRGEP